MRKPAYLVFIILTTAVLSMLITACKDKQTKEQEVVRPKMNQTKEPETSTKTEKKAILCFGNSLTAGYGLDEKEAWPQLMQDRIDSLSLDYAVVNAGLSGETTAGGLNRIDWVLNQPVDIFFLELGANDMLRGLDVKTTEDNLKKIIEKVLKKYPGTPIVIAGMLAPPSMGKDYEKAFNNIFTKLSNDFKGHLIPFLLDGVAGNADLNLKDNKHPNQKGQKIVLENVWSAIEPLLSK